MIKTLIFIPRGNARVKNLLIRTLKVHDPFKKVTVKVYSENITNCIFLVTKRYFKLKQFDNSHNDVVYVQKKLRKVHVPEERLFSKTEVFLKQIMLSVGISKAGKTSIFFVEPNTKVNVKCYLMYYCRK